MARRVAFVGPLPPPVHGFSTVCAHVLDLLKTTASVEVFDRSPRANNVLLDGVAQFGFFIRNLTYIV